MIQDIKKLFDSKLNMSYYFKMPHKCINYIVLIEYSQIFLKSTKIVIKNNNNTDLMAI